MIRLGISVYECSLPAKTLLSRYEKTISTISEWENEKTVKAQRRKDRKEVCF